MNDSTVLAIWILSFGLYLLIYTYWIPLRTQQRIEQWLRSEESDETLLMSLEVITKRIREQMLVNFEEFMLPQARENLQKFWSGAMGNAAKELKNSDEGAGLSILHNISKELEGQPWYIQSLGAKLLPAIAEASKTQPKRKTDAGIRMGLQE